jgi:uncharacterized protein YfaT (DUF1175 family)
MAPLLALLPVLLLAGSDAHRTLLQRAIAERALAQLQSFDPAWTPEQRDCAGLVRFVYRQAFQSLEPARAQRPLWRDGSGRPSDFADAEHLLAGSFFLLGRERSVGAALQSGDLVAFRQGEPGAEIFHLMLVVRDRDPAHGAYVVYHPGEPGAAMRGGPLEELTRQAPHEWRPTAENPAFLGFYRFKEWSP